MDDLRIKFRITDTTPTANAPTTLMSAESLRRIEGLRIESQAEFVRQQTLLEKLKNLPPDKLAEAIPTTGVQDTLLSSLLDQKVLAEQRLVSLSKEYGPAHSEVLKASALVADLRTKVGERVDGILIGLEAKVDSLGMGLTNLQQEVKKAMDTDLDKAAESRPYWQAKRDLEELQRFRQVLYMKIAQERTELELPKSSMVEIVDKAVPGIRPVRPNKPLNIALGIIIGLVVGVGLAFFIEYLDTSVKTIDDVERSLGTPVLGVIPQNVGLILDEGAESPHAEAYRVLRTNLLFSRKDDKLNTMAVVSAGAGEGKSTTVFNLATVFAQSGQRVLIVDSDLRRPTLHKMLRVTNNIGLTNYLLKQNTLEEVIQTTSCPPWISWPAASCPAVPWASSAPPRCRTSSPSSSSVTTSSSSIPRPSWASATPPFWPAKWTWPSRSSSTAAIPQPMNIRAKQMIEKVGGNLVGIVLNNINMSQDESYYYYSGYYHDYYSKNEDQEPTPPPGGGPGDKDKLDIKQKY